MISDIKNTLNDLIIEANLLLAKMPKEQSLCILNAKKEKLTAINKAREIFGGKHIESEEEVYNEIMQACIELHMSMKDTIYEISMFLMAFNDLQAKEPKQ